MSWKRGNPEVWPEGVPPTQRTLAQNAVSAYGRSIHTLYRLREPSGRERWVFYQAGIYGPARDRNGEGERKVLARAELIDLLTGEEFEIDEHSDVQAKPVAVADLPDALRDAWPKDGKGKPLKQGVDEHGEGVNRDHIMALAEATGGRVPEQLGLL